MFGSAILNEKSTFCRVCLCSDKRIAVSLNDEDLRREYEQFIKREISYRERYASGFCAMCLHLYRKSIAFQAKCINSEEILINIQYNNLILRKETLITTSIRIIDTTEGESNVKENAEDFPLFQVYCDTSLYEKTQNCKSAENIIKENTDIPLNNIKSLENEVKREIIDFSEDVFHTADLSDEYAEVPKRRIDKRKPKLTTNTHKKRKRNRNLVANHNYDPSIAAIITLTEEQVFEEMDQLRNSSNFQESIHKCLSCAIVFTSKYLHNDHKDKFHSNEAGPYSCHMCQRTFSENSVQRRHIAKHLQKYVCIACGKTLCDWQAARTHYQRSHEESGELCCNICLKSFKNGRTLQLHMNVHDASKRYACDHCPRVYAMKTQLADHMSCHTGVKRYLCPTCKKSFARRSAMVQHTMLHDDTARRRYRCEECGLSYASQGKLNEHLKVGARHLKPEMLRFGCEQCTLRFLYASELSTHIKQKHGDSKPDKKYICDSCGRSFAAFRNLKQHKEKNHDTGDIIEANKEPALRRYRCKGCFMTFYSSAELDVHKAGCCFSIDLQRNNHTEKRNKREPRTCPVCQKTLTTTAGLKMHMNCHSGDRPFVCIECGRRFTQPGNLKRHIRVRHFT